MLWLLLNPLKPSSLLPELTKTSSVKIPLMALIKSKPNLPPFLSSLAAYTESPFLLVLLQFQSLAFKTSPRATLLKMPQILSSRRRKSRLPTNSTPYSRNTIEEIPIPIPLHHALISLFPLFPTTYPKSQPSIPSLRPSFVTSSRNLVASVMASLFFNPSRSSTGLRRERVSSTLHSPTTR